MARPAPKNSTPNFGWIRDDAAVAEVRSRLGKRADIEAFTGPDKEPLKGYAQRQIQRGNLGVFPHLAAMERGFNYAYRQQRGVCVGCGTARAIEDSWLFSVVYKQVYGRVVRVDVASIYAGSRTQRDLGNGRLGNGDGSVGAWAAKWVHDWGALEQREVAGYDLRGLNEKLAVQWGRPGAGVPRKVLDEIGEIEIRCLFCRTPEDILDAAYAGFGIAYCDRFTFGTKDKSGVSRLTRPASHCTELIGACVSTSGEPLIGGQQSWGDGSPPGPRTLRYKGGTVQLRKGMCFVPLSEFAEGLEDGAEAWAFQVVTGWR